MLGLSQLEEGILALLRAAPGLQLVRTFEPEVRECLFSGDKLIDGFRAEELPAVNVTAQLQSLNSIPFTASEIGYEIPITVVSIVRAQKKDEARQTAAALSEEVQRVLNAARKSDSGLGANTLVIGTVAAEAVVLIEQKPHHFALCEVKAMVLKVVEL